jgi:phosphoglycolate phosphatase-like HAD superfamily hydrolase
MVIIKKHLAVFDIDGTLTQSVGVHQSAYLHALKLSGFTEIDTNWGNYPHHTDTAIFKQIFELQSGMPMSGEDVTKFEALLHEAICGEVAGQAINEVEGACAFLQSLLKHSEFHVVFATGSLKKPARFKLLQAGIPAAQELIVAANQFVSREEVVNEAIRTAQSFYNVPEFERVVSFGDGLWDWKTAQNLGLEFVGISNRQLLESGVETYFDNFTDARLFHLMGMGMRERDGA